MPAPSIGSRPASPIQPHEEVPAARTSTATKPLAEKATRGQPAGVLSNLASRPRRTDIQSNQARLGTLQRLNDSKLLNDTGHYEKAAPIAKQIRAQLPAYENALGEQVVAGEIAAEERLELMSSMTASLKNVEGIGSKIADIDAGGQGLAQQVGNLLRALAPDLADRATPERVESLGRNLTLSARTRILPDDPATQSAIDALDLIKAFHETQDTSLIPRLQNALRGSFPEA
ncbi:hypothetical protein NDK50_26680 [Paraburkholderia bryophila]|uniref:hypothetical protein n=1 Tax=Paraburkholderia bryophila TaxID=420952 RepID=UPI002349106F|nr:hypothetical protein [Paraburkholderia bryophila]WCM24401.1 hypothetical protein NDK50_26680 [Paraburkholderia bryophila]